MITLYSYPELFGVADNNGYGLKVFAFLRLAGVPFTHKHIFDASAAPPAAHVHAGAVEPIAAWMAVQCRTRLECAATKCLSGVSIS